VGFFWGIQDLRMKWSGRKSTATVTQVFQNSKTLKLDVQYRYSDEQGSEHAGSFGADANWKPPTDMKVSIIYLPGNPDSSRLASASSITGIVLFLVGLSITVFGFWYFNNESVNQAHADIARDNARGPLRRGLASSLLRDLFG
jgi:hypothetical protein